MTADINFDKKKMEELLEAVQFYEQNKTQILEALGKAKAASIEMARVLENE